MGAIRFIIILIIVWQLLKLAGRYLLPIFLKKSVEKMQNNMDERYRDATREQRPEGDVSIDKKPNSTSRLNDDVGEYVDFEEVE